MAEDTNTQATLPEAKNPIDATEAARIKALINLDIARFRDEKARALSVAANADVMIARSELAIADIDRRVANVDYPVEQKAEQKTESDSEESV